MQALKIEERCMTERCMTTEQMALGTMIVIQLNAILNVAISKVPIHGLTLRPVIGVRAPIMVIPFSSI